MDTYCVLPVADGQLIQTSKLDIWDMFDIYVVKSLPKGAGLLR